MMDRYPLLYRGLRLASLLLAVLALIWPEVFRHHALWPAVALIVLLGIPHGATDHHIFKSLMWDYFGSGAMLRFYLGYLGLMLGYGLLWWWSPVLSLLVFILLSMYHFGQSNWNYCPLPVRWQVPVYLLNGAFVLGVPVLWHFASSKPILEAILTFSIPPISMRIVSTIIGLLTGANVLLLVVLWKNKLLTNRQARGEAGNLLILLLLFLTMPLLLGFAIYFSAWHALSSVFDQAAFFRMKKPGYRLSDYLLQALPYTVLAIVGLVAMVWLSGQLEPGASLGLLFIFLSLVTLPHMVLMDLLYQNKVQTMQMSDIALK